MKLSYFKEYYYMIIILLILFFSFLYIKDAGFLTDEYAHFMTISELASGHIASDTFSRNAQIPTYYYLMSIFKRINPNLEIGDLRAIQAIMSFITLVFVYLIAKEIDKNNAIIKTLQVLAFPLMHIFLVLVYNESLTLLFTLASFYFVLKKQYVWSWFAVLVSVSLRQNNVIWILFLIIYQWQDLKSDHFLKETILQFIKQTWGYMFSIIFVGIFLLINKGPALADAHANPLAIHVENPLFLLLLLPTLFLPLFVYSNKKIAKIIIKKPQILIIVLLSLFCYWNLFKAENFFNSEHYLFHLRNKVLHHMLTTSLHKIIYFIPIILGIIWLFVQKILDKRHYAIYVFSIVYLALLWLVEPRYYIIPMVFFILFRKVDNTKIETIQLLYFAILAAINIWGSVNFRFFL